jgi:hypothetical protein
VQDYTLTIGGAMLGAWEFTILGNVAMGIMAIAGVCSMIYAVGTSRSPFSPTEEPLDEASAIDVRRAA